MAEQTKTGYWKGPFGVLVPNDTYSVVAEDGGNSWYQDGGCTEMYCGPNMTEAEYKVKFCNQNPVDGMWYYKGVTGG